MDLFALVTPVELSLCVALAFVAGVVKGVVGFAMPMIMISGLGSIVAPDLALAGLILPTLVTNGMQALRQGPGAAWSSVRRFRIFLVVGCAALLLSAQLVTVLPVWLMLALIGGPIVLFALSQIAGRALVLPGADTRIEIAIAAVAGFFGGLSGVWGPPVVAYLTALHTEKAEQARIQGVIYGLGAVALAVAHIGSGVLNAESAWFSLTLIPSAVMGMWLGGRLQDRIDQAMFRRATLWTLLIAGLNLLRRAFF
ncbi:TSUP family transporter [Litorisediminicola beolgyonensis]|uniref:Probable membrane transporter protein n=1 Tax=Litorisediminicola beolgyonensis TaxID=1173614 RepID=A0ABW3ZG48_9RHOB